MDSIEEIIDLCGGGEKQMRSISRRSFNSAIIGVFVSEMVWRTEKLKGKNMENNSKNSSLAIDEGMFVKINGVDQWITIRGQDLGNPILLWLHGGPGIAMSSQEPIFAEWEKYFTLVHWDQPGGGATYAKNMDTGEGPLTPERFTRDGIAVAECIRKHLHAEKMVLMGMSWGTQLGLMMVKKRPDLFSAYVGTAQVVSGSRGCKLGYELALEAARKRDDKAAIEELERVGPPPYKTVEDFFIRQKYTNPPGLPPSPAEKSALEEIAKILSVSPPADARYIAKGLPDYDGMKVFIETQKAMFKEGWKFEARDLGSLYTIPIFVFQGENDLNAPAVLAREFINEIQAPIKKYVEIPGAGHMTIAFHAELLRLLRTYVRPLVTHTSSN